MGRPSMCVVSVRSVYDSGEVNPYDRVVRLALLTAQASVSYTTLGASRRLRSRRGCLMWLLPEVLYKYLGCTL